LQSSALRSPAFLKLLNEPIPNQDQPLNLTAFYANQMTLSTVGKRLLRGSQLNSGVPPTQSSAYAWVVPQKFTTWL